MASKEAPSYFIEFSPSGKAKCKKCMTSIDKGLLRIGIKIEDLDKGYATKVYNHISCFKVPNKQFPIIKEFLATYLQDISKEGTILQTHYDEILDALEKNSSSLTGSASKKRASTSSKGKNDDDDEDNNQTIIARIKQQYYKMESGEFDEEPSNKKKTKANDSIPKKKKKSTNDDIEVIDVEETLSSSSSPNMKIITDMTTDNEKIQYQASIYGKYNKMKSDTIKDILGYNKQVKTGTKDFLIYKLIDGISYNGRLARCTVCDGGRLKIIEESNNTNSSVHATVVCSGTFDETIQIRIPCSFTCTTATAPRKHPWYMEEPTEEEKELIEKEEAEARGEDVASSSNGKGGKGNSNDVIDELIELSKSKVIHWNLTNRDGLRKAAEDVISLLQSSTIKSIDIPSDAKQVMQKVGQVLTQNRTSTVIDILPIVVQLFGYKEDKIQKESKKQSNIANAIKNSKNGPVITAFQELSELYFKTGNRNAGSTYIKVVKALSDISFEITESNAKGLGSGKTKIPYIGKSTVDKILEFCQTGTMEKLEEKRSEVA